VDPVVVVVEDGDDDVVDVVAVCDVIDEDDVEVLGGRGLVVDFISLENGPGDVGEAGAEVVGDDEGEVEDESEATGEDGDVVGFGTVCDNDADTRDPLDEGDELGTIND
jgi:hypothetical protein